MNNNEKCCDIDFEIFEFIDYISKMRYHQFNPYINRKRILQYVSIVMSYSRHNHSQLQFIWIQWESERGSNNTQQHMIWGVWEGSKKGKIVKNVVRIHYFSLQPRSCFFNLNVFLLYDWCNDWNLHHIQIFQYFEN